MAITPLKKYLANVAAGIGGYEMDLDQPGELTPTLNVLPGTPWITGVGDLDGDGIAEVMVGGPGSDDKAIDAGRVFVAIGLAAGVPSFTLTDPVDTIIVDGILANDLLGATVGTISDLNGDLKPELLMGAPLMDRGGADRGAGFVIWSPAAGDGIDDLILSAHTIAMHVYFNDGQMKWTRSPAEVENPALLIDVAVGRRG